jgi:hypothetical protein
LSISTVFDSRFAESLGCRPRAIGAANALAASPKQASRIAIRCRLSSRA